MQKHLSARDEICPDAIAKYYELAADWKAVATVRDRELAAVEKKGMFHRICEVHIERCRLLKLAGGLTARDLDAARLAADRLRVPDRCLEKIAKIECS
jgi:hypothetical protein